MLTSSVEKKLRSLEETMAFVLSICEARHEYYNAIFTATEEKIRSSKNPKKLSFLENYLLNARIKAIVYGEAINRIRKNELSQDVIDDVYDLCVRRHYIFLSEKETALTFNEAPFLRDLYESLEPFVTPWKSNFIKDNKYSLIPTQSFLPELAWKTDSNGIFLKYFSDEKYEATQALLRQVREQLRIPEDNDIVDQVIENMQLLSSLHRKSRAVMGSYNEYRAFYEEVVRVHDFFDGLQKKLNPAQTASPPEAASKKKKHKKKPTSSLTTVDQGVQPQAFSTNLPLVFSADAQSIGDKNVECSELTPVQSALSPVIESVNDLPEEQQDGIEQRRRQEKQRSWIEAFREKRAEKRRLEEAARQALQAARDAQSQLKHISEEERRKNAFNTGVLRVSGLNNAHFSLVENIFTVHDAPTIYYRDIQGLFGKESYQLRGSITAHGGSHCTITLDSLPTTNAAMASPAAIGFFDSPASDTHAQVADQVKGGTYRSHQAGHAGQMDPNALKLIRYTLIRGGISRDVLEAVKAQRAQEIQNNRVKVKP